jgi:hypothetical protein
LVASEAKVEQRPSPAPEIPPLGAQMTWQVVLSKT